MKRIIVQGKLLILLGIMHMTYGQNQTEKIIISQSVNSQKLHEIQLTAEKTRDFQRKEVERLMKLGYEEFIEGEDGSFAQLIGTNELGTVIYLQTMNQNIVNTLGANFLHSGFDGFNLTGNGMVIGLWEPAKPRPLHEILKTPLGISRISYATTNPPQSSSINRHATHVSGTLIGNQTNANSSHQLNVRGVAYEATIKAYDWNQAAAEMADEAENNGLLVANTSFGYAPAPLNEVEYGRYSQTSRDWDAVMCGAPFLQIVKPAGNVRDDSPFIVPQVNEKDGFDLLESSGSSKNVLVVSAFDLTQDAPSETNPVYDINLVEVPYSSWGPTDDGRIKPDITAHGHSVFSSIETSNSGYGLLSGTSMATAGVSGAITLLQQYYNEKFGYLYGSNEVPYLWSSSIRALIVHTADEIGDNGPDYKYGWGAMNTVSAAEIIEKRGKSTIIREENLSDGEQFKLNVISNGYEPLVVTMAWTDPEGEVDLENQPILDDPTHKLVNDLDIKLIRLDTNGAPTTLIDSNGDDILFPWKRLEGITDDVIQLSASSSRGINNVDNIEKIEIPIEFIPEKGGLFQLVVSHKDILTDNCVGTGQNFSLIVSGVSFCTDEIVLVQHQDDVLTENEENVHVKANNITASNVLEEVPDPASDEYLVEYEAASYIELVPQGIHGFTAKNGSDFYAHIECDLEINQAFSSREINSMLDNQKADKNIPMEESIVVYPNPVINNFLNVQFELNDSFSVQILLYDLNGQIVFDKSSQEFESGKHKQVLDLSQLPKGVYILKVNTPENSLTQKIIKK